MIRNDEDNMFAGCVVGEPRVRSADKERNVTTCKTIYQNDEQFHLRFVPLELLQWLMCDQRLHDGSVDSIAFRTAWPMRISTFTKAFLSQMTCNT